MGRPKETIDPKVGQRIRQIREHMTIEGKKVSREMFAEHYGVSTQAVAYWENGQRKVPQRIIEDLAESQGVDVDFILGKHDTMDFQEKLSCWDANLSDAAAHQLKLIDHVEYLLKHSVYDSMEPDELESYLQEIDDFIIFKYSQIMKRKENHE